MERTKQLSEWFSFEHHVKFPDRPVVSCPFLFTQNTGREEIRLIQEPIQPAPFCPVSDTTIRENQQFRYVVFAPDQCARFDRAIILLHGLNERSWLKYLAWAEELVMTCGVPVILFPIAFHMNRTPATWYTPRWLMPWLNRRKQEIKDLCNASFFNVALSSRLSASPLRFYSSGLESAYNLLQLIMELKQGEHPLFSEDVRVDFFAYSIGALLVQVLLMADPEKCLGASRLFTFCGGSVFERMNGNSRDIIDQEAYLRIREFYLNDFLLAGHTQQTDKQPQTACMLFTEAFRAMIPSLDHGGKRQAFFSQAQERIRMVSLRQDIVIPTCGVREAVGCLLADYMVEELEFPYPCTHQVPFPDNGKIDPSEVMISFRAVFERAARFLA
ncbi:MAG: DUF6051 family protein [Bacteroidales bacterium]|nr:DUF6051 family protein [Bacteroidales bacterium]MDD2263904.1 DUF6051 family protein [Bacteroidales bacterium]MDD2831138.1 DUF6051 family protein [Bacteroidales bacterium]MDD3209249.1 DUF6051 family protein [Bacteroidales bacterium]MDD3697624.1 DUF6051 family protein [Bacteroidales bacterium]